MKIKNEPINEEIKVIFIRASHRAFISFLQSFLWGMNLAVLIVFRYVLRCDDGFAIHFDAKQLIYSCQYIYKTRRKKKSEIGCVLCVYLNFVPINQMYLLHIPLIRAVCVCVCL